MGEPAYHPDARWMKRFGVCIYCGKTSTGVLMSSRNEQIGLVCDKHARAAIERAGRAALHKGVRDAK